MRSGAILAGGQASRFGGRDKSALVVEGWTILERQMAELSRVSRLQDILVIRSSGGVSGVTGPRGSRGFRVHGGHGGHGNDGNDQADRGQQDQRGDQGQRGRTRTLNDLVPGCGPLGGLYTALTEARGDAVFVVACDMPFITAPLVEHLFELSRHADLVVPRTEDGYHPLCAVYTRACLDPVSRRLAEGRLKLMDLGDEVRTRIVAADELESFGDRHRLLANVNTPAQYASLEALHDHKP